MFWVPLSILEMAKIGCFVGEYVNIYLSQKRPTCIAIYSPLEGCKRQVPLLGLVKFSCFILWHLSSTQYGQWRFVPLGRRRDGSLDSWDVHNSATIVIANPPKKNSMEPRQKIQYVIRDCRHLIFPL